MNLKNLTIYPIPYGTPEWYNFRLNGIGGSEVARLFPETCDTSYGNSTEMYYHKIGYLPIKQTDNEAMFRGRRDEASIGEEWMFWDGLTDEFGTPNYINNFKNNTIIRKCRNLNGYVVNSIYPWLFASVDRLINKGGYKLTDGSMLKKEGILEIKNLSGYVSQKYTAGIPNDFLYQVQDYLLVLELDYAEFAVRIDGRHMDVFPIEANKIIQEQILERSYHFWMDRVLPGKKLVSALRTAERFGKTKEMEECEAGIMELEPNPTQGESYRNFIKERFKTERTEAQGNSWQYSLCSQYEVLSYICKKLDGDKSLLYNSILNEIRKSGSNQLTFDKGEYCRFNKKLTNHITVKLDKEKINEQIEILNSDFTL